MEPGESPHDPARIQHLKPGSRFVRMRETERYDLVFISIILSIGVTAAGAGELWSRLLITLLLGTSLLLALWTSHVRLSTLLVSIIGLLSGFTVIILQTFLHSDKLPWFPEALNLLLVAVTLIAIARRLLIDQVINRQTILGGLCMYLLLGLFFTYLYAVVALLTTVPMLLPLSKATLSDYLYFSFVTLTTTGYGDLVPHSGVARGLAVTEALCGQLYLVSVLALLVGNVGKPNVRRRKRADRD